MRVFFRVAVKDEISQNGLELYSFGNFKDNSLKIVFHNLEQTYLSERSPDLVLKIGIFKVPAGLL